MHNLVPADTLIIWHLQQRVIIHRTCCVRTGADGPLWLRKGSVVSRVKAFPLSTVKAAWSAGCLFSRFTSASRHTLTFTLYLCFCSGLLTFYRILAFEPYITTQLLLQMSSHQMSNRSVGHVQVVVSITLPLSSRICECLVPYFDSSSPDSRNVSLVPGCVLFGFTQFTFHGCFFFFIFGFTFKCCLKAWSFCINMQQEPKDVP